MPTDESAAVSNPHLQREIDLASERPTSAPPRGNSLGVSLLLAAFVTAGAAAGVRSWKTPAGSTLASAEIESHARPGAPVIPDALPRLDVEDSPEPEPEPVHVAVASPVVKRSARSGRRASRRSAVAALPQLPQETKDTSPPQDEEWIFEDPPVDPPPVVPLQKAKPARAVPVQSPAAIPPQPVLVQTPAAAVAPERTAVPVAAPVPASAEAAVAAARPPGGPFAADVQPPSSEAPVAAVESDL